MEWCEEGASVGRGVSGCVTAIHAVTKNLELSRHFADRSAHIGAADREAAAVARHAFYIMGLIENNYTPLELSLQRCSDTSVQ